MKNEAIRTLTLFNIEIRHSVHSKKILHCWEPFQQQEVVRSNGSLLMNFSLFRLIFILSHWGKRKPRCNLKSLTHYSNGELYNLGGGSQVLLNNYLAAISKIKTISFFHDCLLEISRLSTRRSSTVEQRKKGIEITSFRKEIAELDICRWSLKAISHSVQCLTATAFADPSSWSVGGSGRVWMSTFKRSTVSSRSYFRKAHTSRIKRIVSPTKTRSPLSTKWNLFVDFGHEKLEYCTTLKCSSTRCAIYFFIAHWRQLIKMKISADLPGCAVTVKSTISSCMVFSGCLKGSLRTNLVPIFHSLIRRKMKVKKLSPVEY